MTSISGARPLINSSLAEADSDVVKTKTLFNCNELIVSPSERTPTKRFILLSEPNFSFKYLFSFEFHCSLENIWLVNCPVIILASSTQFRTDPPPLYRKSITKSIIPFVLKSEKI